MPGTTTKIIFGDNLDVTDQGSGVIRVDGGGATGVGAVRLLSTTTLAAPGTFDVSGISQAYNDLILVLIARSVVGSVADTADLRFNNDGTSIYDWQNVIGGGTTASANASAAVNTLRLGSVPGGTAPAGPFGVIEAVVFGYASTSWWKSVTATDYVRWATGTSGEQTQVHGGEWGSTAAINRIQIGGGSSFPTNFATGSQLRIYGRL